MLVSIAKRRVRILPVSYKFFMWICRNNFWNLCSIHDLIQHLRGWNWGCNHSSWEDEGGQVSCYIINVEESKWYQKGFFCFVYFGAFVYCLLFLWTIICTWCVRINYNTRYIAKTRIILINFLLVDLNTSTEKTRLVRTINRATQPQESTTQWFYN